VAGKNLLSWILQSQLLVKKSNKYIFNEDNNNNRGIIKRIGCEKSW